MLLSIFAEEQVVVNSLKPELKIIGIKEDQVKVFTHIKVFIVVTLHVFT